MKKGMFSFGGKKPGAKPKPAAPLASVFDDDVRGGGGKGGGGEKPEKDPAGDVHAIRSSHVSSTFFIAGACLLSR